MTDEFEKQVREWAEKLVNSTGKNNQTLSEIFDALPLDNNTLQNTISSVIKTALMVEPVGISFVCNTGKITVTGKNTDDPKELIYILTVFVLLPDLTGQLKTSFGVDLVILMQMDTKQFITALFKIFTSISDAINRELDKHDAEINEAVKQANDQKMTDLH